MVATDKISGNRLGKGDLSRNFEDIHPPLSPAAAVIEADRCFYCHDAPCVEACPTGIDIPSFIARIAGGDLSGSARKIFEQNIMGGMCARVCPVETLCEEVCVRCVGEQKPVKIGLLQRRATDHAMARGEQYFSRAASTGRKIAVVGSGPAGLSCAHRLAMRGHDVEIFEKRGKPGGLNEHGIAAYKVVDDFAQKEIEYILSIGGITITNGVGAGTDVSLDSLRKKFDAVFIGIGLGAVRQLVVEGAQLCGVHSALEFIESVRQCADLGEVPVGGKVVVIGGGMTAVDVASQSLRLGADEVAMVYRRGPEQQNASDREISFVRDIGAVVRYWLTPVRVLGKDGAVCGVEFERTEICGGQLKGTGEKLEIAADMVLVAAGQLPDSDLAAFSLDTDGAGRLVVDDECETSRAGVWAGGDCVAGGDDLTVQAVEHGKIAAESIDRWLRRKEAG